MSDYAERDDHEARGGRDSHDNGDQGGNGFVDETLDCRDCGAQFVFSAGEQDFYKEKGYENKPVRCKGCKDAKKARMDGGRGGRGGGGYRDRDGGYGDRRGGGGQGVCYAFQRGECDRGSSCRFSHEGGGGGGGGSRGGGGGYGGRGGGGGGYRDNNRDGRSGGGGGYRDLDGRGGGGGGGGVCYAFQRGECDRGSSCRFSHN